MNIEKWLDAYEGYRDTTLGMVNALAKRSTEFYEGLPVGEMMEFVNYEELDREMIKRKRILAHATRRIQRAIKKIKDPKASGYLICKYLYRMSNEEIANEFCYCERHIYRLSSKARKMLALCLEKTPPRVMRMSKGQRFSYRRRHRRKYRKYGRRTKASSESYI